MAKAEKASEPTMDEILASIRKIIAEEPVGKNGVNGIDSGVDAAFAAPKASIDDILGMADAPAASSARVPVSTGPSEPGKKVEKHSQTANALTLASDAKSANGSGRAAFPAPTGGKSPDGASVGDRGKPTPAMKAEAAQGVDFGLIVPGKASGPGTDADDAERRSIPGRLPDWLGRSGTPMPQPTRGAPISMPAEAKAGSPIEPTGHPDKKSDLEAKTVASKAVATPAPTSATAASPAKPTTNPAAATATASATKAAPPANGVQPAPNVEAKGGVVKPESAPPAKAASPSAGTTGSNTAASEAKPTASVDAKVATTAAPTSQTKPAAPAGSATATPAAPKTNGASAPNGSAAGASAPIGPSASAKPAAPGPVVSAPAATEKATVPVPVSESVAPVAKPAVLDKTKMAKPTLAGELVASALPVGGVRTLDDTIIELLRPMIRQWLDDNMPRMVEKALRIELAASLQAKGPSGQTDPSKH